VKFPWEDQLPAVPVEDTVALLQKDFAYAIQCTAVTVHSNRPEFQITVNTPRGQIVPRNECRFTDGTTIELQDIGMPQPGLPFMSMKDLLAQMWNLVRDLGLELQL
jgi:hypothetical protein